MNRVVSTAVIGSVLFASPISNAQTSLSCPTAADAQAAFQSGEAQKWPNYTEADGARVQRQYPNTGLVAQSKFISLPKNNVGLCQYYSHIGLVITTASIGLEKGQLLDGAYWRSEYTESTPERDQPGQEMIEVCMTDKNGSAFPSSNCQFSNPTKK